jgi:hypothetical protein
MANPIPGTVVATGSGVGPSGAQGYQGATGTTGTAGATGPAGPTAVSTDAQNQSKLGSDNLLWTPPKIGKYRYYYGWHCDHPTSQNQATGANGTGGGVTPLALAGGSAVGRSHQGIYNITCGAIAGGYGYYASGAIADIQLGFFTKLAFRVVVNVLGIPPAPGGPNPDGYYYYYFGFADSVTAAPAANAMLIGFDPTVTRSNWTITCSNAGARTLTNSNVTLTSNQWYDVALYWDSNGLKARVGNWNGTTPPTTVVGPLTVNLPATTTNLFWVCSAWVQSYPGAIYTSSYAYYLDLVEVCGEYTTPGGYRGEDLVTAF